MVIKNYDGRWKSEVSEEEIEQSLQSDIENLTDDEKECLKILLEENTESDSLLSMINEVDYERPVVDIEEWLEDPYYMGEVGKSLYPVLKEDLIELFRGDYQEVIWTGSVGAGKTWCATLSLLRVLYELSCMKDPQVSYGLGSGAPIAITVYSTTEIKARRVPYANVLTHLTKSPYFMEVLKPKITKKETRFESKNISILPLPSSTRATLGENVIAAFVDESNFVRVSSEGAIDQSETVGEVDILYNSILTRIKSRFLKFGRIPGMLITVSSKTTHDSFLERKIMESRTNSHLFVRDHTILEIKPEFKDAKKFRVLVGKGRTRSKVLKEDEDVTELLKDNKDLRVIEIPEDFRPNFESKLEDSLRDIAGVSTDSISPFIHQTEKIQECGDGRKHPFTCLEYDPTDVHDGFLWDMLVEPDPKGGWRPKINPDTKRHAHIDLSMLVRGGDATGLCVAHVAGIKNVIRRDKDGNIYAEPAPIIYVDFMLRIKPPASGEASPGDVRKLLYQMSERGFPIYMVTFDRHQSFESVRKCADRGYVSEFVSVDTSSTPYDMLKEAFYEGRIITYKYDLVIKELLKLEWNAKKRKVDHPKKGSKDVADALASVIFTLSTKLKEDPLPIEKGMYDTPEGDSKTWLMHTENDRKDNGPETLPVTYDRKKLEYDDYDDEEEFDFSITMG